VDPPEVCKELLRLTDLWSAAVSEQVKATADLVRTTDQSARSEYASLLNRLAALKTRTQDAREAFESHLRKHQCHALSRWAELRSTPARG